MYKNPQEALKKFEKERDLLLTILWENKPIKQRLSQVYRNINHIKAEMKLKVLVI